MRFMTMTLINHTPDPVSGVLKSPTEHLAEVVDKAVLHEEPGFDGYGVGVRHHTAVAPGKES